MCFYNCLVNVIEPFLVLVIRFLLGTISFRIEHVGFNDIFQVFVTNSVCIDDSVCVKVIRFVEITGTQYVVFILRINQAFDAFLLVLFATVILNNFTIFEFGDDKDRFATALAVALVLSTVNSNVAHLDRMSLLCIYNSVVM